MDEIPPGFRLSAIQRRVKNNVEWIEPGLRRAIAAVRYPVHHVEFETCMPPIPKYPHTRPYQTIPFQWSNHIVAADGARRHEEYLCSDPKDPREEFALSLLQSIGREGSISVYSGHGAWILRELAVTAPSGDPRGRHGVPPVLPDDLQGHRRNGESPAQKSSPRVLRAVRPGHGRIAERLDGQGDLGDFLINALVSNGDGKRFHCATFFQRAVVLFWHPGLGLPHAGLMSTGRTLQECRSRSGSNDPGNALRRRGP